MWFKRRAKPVPAPSGDLNPLASKDNAEVFGTALGVSGDVLTGLAALQVAAEHERAATKGRPRPAGEPPRGASRA